MKTRMFQLWTILLAFSFPLSVMATEKSATNRMTTTEQEAVRAFTLDPSSAKESFDGWGVSLCWWANECGKWSDQAIDEIIDWLVSPDQLNFRIFRYNIGGGEDPQNRHCTPHHMGAKGGKGLRAEMEGFKDATDDAYHWDRDAAQRKIMLKIKEKRPDAIFEAFSNSAPYYMTYSGCCAGHEDASKDNLRPEYYEEFAHYLVDVCKHYKEQYGIEFYTLEPFNEPLTSYWYANGSQEGCHFDLASQVAFLKVLSPILKASGLKTIISASDETAVKHAVEAIEYYKKENVLDLVGQFNTHTYSADNESRDRYHELTAEAGKPMWMSEVGGGEGSGFTADLNLAQKTIDDIRHLQPSAWLDWQYVDEGDGRWAMVIGSFAKAEYKRAKSFYVRQQFSRFIREGYQIIETSDAHSLAAQSADKKLYVLVLLNTADSSEQVQIGLKPLGKNSKGKATVYRTSEQESLASVNAFTIDNQQLKGELPAKSITTVVVSFD